MIPRVVCLAVALSGCRTSMSPGIEPGDEPTVTWGRLLKDVVTPDGYVDYDLLEDQRGILDSYVAWLGREQNWQGRITRDWHARYLNAYNALVLYQVLERDRPDSVLDPRRILPFDGSAFFVETQFKLGYDWLSLSEVEHERVRQKELDLRDHAALNCASRSCPPMRDELYRHPRDGLSDQLDDQMARWVMGDRGIRFEGDQVLFSPIFDWYARDFSFWSAGLDLCTIAADYAIGERQKRLRALADQGCPHGFFEYDWSLNDAP